MLFIIFVIALVGGIAWYISDDNGFAFTSMAIGGIGTLISLLIIISAHSSVKGDLLEFKNYKEAIDIKLESRLYADQFGINDKEVVNEIRFYNECVIKRQKYIGNLWFGIYNPKEFSELELIDYSIASEAERFLKD